MDNDSRLKIRPEFERQLSNFSPIEQDAILDTVERLGVDGADPEELSLALVGITMSSRRVAGHRISICFRTLPSGDLSVLYPWRWPSGVPLM